MTTPAEVMEEREVSPLELFYDLVFVFAVSQLSEHLLDDLTWRGAAETLVLLCAGLTVWAPHRPAPLLLDLDLGVRRSEPPRCLHRVGLVLVRLA